MSPGRRREMVDREHPKLPLVRQCAPRFREGRLLLDVSRSSLYYGNYMPVYQIAPSPRLRVLRAVLASAVLVKRSGSTSPR